MYKTRKQREKDAVNMNGLTYCQKIYKERLDYGEEEGFDS